MALGSCLTELRQFLQMMMLMAVTFFSRLCRYLLYLQLFYLAEAMFKTYVVLFLAVARRRTFLPAHSHHHVSIVFSSLGDNWLHCAPDPSSVHSY